MNNRLRRALDAAVGTLTLRSPDRAKRLAAAQSVFAQPDPATLPAVERRSPTRTTRPCGRRCCRRAGPSCSTRGPRRGSAGRGGDARRLAVARGAEQAAGGAARPAGGRGPAAQGGAAGRHRLDPAAAPAPGPRPQPLSGDQPRLGAAAGRDRARHHVRRDGRHQHGARRDGDARRLHDLRRAGAAAAPVRRAGSRSAPDRPSRSPSWSPAPSGVAIERTIIRLLYGRPLETLLATWGLSLMLQQAVRTALRRQQPRGRARRPG